MDRALSTDHLPSATTGLNPTGRFVTCRATVAKTERQIFFPFSFCFYLFPKMSRLLNSQHRYSPPLWRHRQGPPGSHRKFGKPTKQTEEKLAVLTDKSPHFSSVSRCVESKISRARSVFSTSVFFGKETLGLLPHYSVYREAHQSKLHVLKVKLCKLS